MLSMLFLKNIATYSEVVRANAITEFVQNEKLSHKEFITLYEYGILPLKANGWKLLYDENGNIISIYKPYEKQIETLVCAVIS